MILKWFKRGALAAAGVCLVGGILFGGDLVSYVSTSARSVRSAVKDAVPLEFELARARDMLEQIIPEMHANIRLIAQEEVEVAGLKSDIQHSEQLLTGERARIQKLAGLLTVEQASYSLGDRQYTHVQLKEDVARRFDSFKEAEVVLAGKQRLLTAREESLAAAMRMLDRSRSQKTLLQTQIEGLESKYRLVKAASVGSQMQLDHSKLAKTEQLIRNIKKRLDVAERVLAHEAKFIQPIAVDTIDEKELLTQINEHLARSEKPDSTELELSYSDHMP